MAKFSALNKPLAVKALSVSLAAHHRDATGGARVYDRALARATRDRPWATAPLPRVDNNTARGVKLSRPEPGVNAPLSRLPVRKTATPAKHPVAGQKARPIVKDDKTLSFTKTRKPAPDKSNAGGKDVSDKPTVNKKVNPGKVRPTAAPVNSSAAKKTSPRVGQFVPKARNKEVTKPAIVKSHAGSVVTPGKQLVDVPKASPSSVKSLVASGIMKPAQMEVNAIGNFGLTWLELSLSYFQKVTKRMRYVPSSVAPHVDSIEDTCLPFWSKYDKCFRNANPLPVSLPSAFFTRKLSPSAELDPPLESNLRDSWSWKRLKLQGFSRPKKTVTFGGEQVREYHVGFNDWKPSYVGQARYRSAEKAKVKREEAMFSKSNGSLTLRADFVKRFKSVHRWVTEAKPQPELASDDYELELVQRVRLNQHHLRQFEKNDGKLSQEPSSRDPLYIMDYWNVVPPKAQPEPIPGPLQHTYGNGVYFLDVNPKLPRTITEADIMQSHEDHPKLMVSGAFESAASWINVSISEP